MNKLITADRGGRRRVRGVLAWLLRYHSNASRRHGRWQQLREMARR
jgi:hypothetical protein